MCVVECEAPDGRKLESKISGFDGLTNFLALLEAENMGPVMVMIWMPEGPSLTFGVGHPVSLVNYEEDIDPPYYAAVGNLKNFWPAEDDYLFSSSGQMSGAPKQNYVSASSALQAAEEFLRTNGSRPCCLNWEEL